MTDDIKISSPEYITVFLQTERRDLYLADLSKCAVHIDAQQLKKGNNELFITEQDIYLPETIAMLHYSPVAITIDVK